ncbi:MAG TPA: ankyrin repeat domain-containing protein [Pyrinomonadaceae bacterium]|nr:ankyrin repeat domain-containing protein [Pyrinomonadaceae bacterium]
MKKILTLILLVIFSFGCGPRSDETTPEMAQSLLKVRGFNFTEEEFFKAIKQADAPAVKLFLQSGINPNARTKQGETAMTVAAAYSDVPTLKILTEKADINEHDALGNTPLFVALKKPRDEIFDYLLEKGADPNSDGTAKNAKNQSVLYVAVLRDKTDAVKKLLEKGADPNRTDDAGSLPISEIILTYSPNMEAYKMILEKMTDVNKQEVGGSTLLIYASKNARLYPDVRREIIKSLLEKGADKRIKDKAGKTALDWAKERKITEAIELLK